MNIRKRCIQQPMILEDNMSISRPSKSWRWVFSILIIGFVGLVLSEIARAGSLILSG